MAKSLNKKNANEACKSLTKGRQSRKYKSFQHGQNIDKMKPKKIKKFESSGIYKRTYKSFQQTF